MRWRRAVPPRWPACCRARTSAQPPTIPTATRRRTRRACRRAADVMQDGLTTVSVDPGLRHQRGDPARRQQARQLRLPSLHRACQPRLPVPVDCDARGRQSRLRHLPGRARSPRSSDKVSLGAGDYVLAVSDLNNSGANDVLQRSSIQIGKAAMNIRSTRFAMAASAWLRAGRGHRPPGGRVPPRAPAHAAPMATRRAQAQ
jgi:hypothetical protein